MLLALLLLGSVVLVKPRIAESDAIEYFSYLHSIFFDGDLDFSNEYTTFYLEDPEGRQGFKETFLDLETATGLKLNFGPIGTAVLWTPFYLTAHVGVIIADALGADVTADGLSLPYRWAVSLGSMFYGALGLLLSYRLARNYAISRGVLFCGAGSVVGDSGGLLHVRSAGDESRGVFVRGGACSSPSGIGRPGGVSAVGRSGVPRRA